MKDYESIHDFHMSILDIDNTSSALGERMYEEKLVRKILRSLPKKFDMKFTTIDKARDISNMKVDELIGSLQTFELDINDRNEKKNKSFAFISNIDEEDVQCDMDTNESVSDAIVLLGRQCYRVLKRMDRKSRPNVKKMKFHISKNCWFQRKERTGEKQIQRKGIHYHGCEGLFTSNQNVLCTSRNRKRGCLSLSQMMIQKESLMMKHLNMSLLLMVGANLMKITVMMMCHMMNLLISTKIIMPKVRRFVWKEKNRRKS